MVYGIVLYSIIFGCRYGVGVDTLTYMLNYLAYNTSEGQTGIAKSMEIGFRSFTELMAYLRAHYSIYFGIIAFVQLFFTLYVFKNKKELLPYAVFTFMIGCSWLTYSNGLRQILAVSLWIPAIDYIARKKWWSFAITVAIAITMHKSAAILFVFYPIFHWRQEWFKNIWVQLALLAVALLLMKVDVIQNLMMQLENVIKLIGYDAYLNEDQATNVHRKARLGLGFIITLTLNILLIINSRKTKEFFQSKFFTIAYDLFVVGIILKYILISSIVFSRINYYFINITFIIAAFTLRYAHRKNKLLFYVIIALFVITFIANIVDCQNNSAYFLFFWQTDLYYLK